MHYSGQDYHIREMVSGASVSFGFRILGAVGQFFFSVLIARLFGADGFGVYALALAIIVVSSTVGRWGLDQSVLKHIAVFADQGEWGAVKASFSKAFLMVSILSLVMTIVIFLLAEWVSTVLFNEPGLTDLLQIMAFGIFPFAILNLIAESLRALKKVGVYTLVQGLLVPVVSALFLMGGVFVSSSVNTVAYAYMLACYVTLVAAFLLWRRALNQVAGREMKGTVRSIVLLNTAAPMAWVALVGIAMSFSETILLGIFHSSSEVGVYAAALRLALLINFVIIAFNSILAPKFAALYKQNALSEITRLANSSVWMMSVLTLPIFGLFFIFPEYLLSLFSPDFAMASTALMILAFGQLINIIAGPVGIILLMSGHETLMRKNALIAALISFSLGVVFIPVYGVIGAACAATTGMIILNGLLSWSVGKKLGVIVTFMRPFLDGR